VKQLRRGDHYKKLSKVIFLGILDFEFVFIELPKFQKEVHELSSSADQWIYFLKYASQVERVLESITSQSIHEAFDVLSRHNWSKAEYDLYMRSLLAKGAEVDRLETALRRGQEEGREKGREEGREEGKQQALAEMVRKLHVKGRSAQEISEITDLSEAEVRRVIGPLK
jgi:predicted transposase/invertase (TIGR01784 family)